MIKNNDQRSKKRIMTIARTKLTETYKAIESCVTTGYYSIEHGVTGGCKRMTKYITDGFELVCDLFIETFFSRDGESIAETKHRLRSHTPKRK